MKYSRLSKLIIVALILLQGSLQAQYTEEQKVIASDGIPSNGYGSAVSTAGDVAIVGAFLDSGIGSNYGSAYIYRYSGGVWIEEQKLVAPDANAQDFFGNAASIFGDVAVVGASFTDEFGFESGSAYVYRYNGTIWVMEQKLIPADGASGDQFGKTVSTSGGCYHSRRC